MTNAQTAILTTIAGHSLQNFYNECNANVAQLFYPMGVCNDRSGNLYIAEQANFVIRKIDPVTGMATVVAGNGNQGYVGDEGYATNASLNAPTYVYVDRKGTIFISDCAQFVVRKVDSNGIITTVAGDGSPGYSGDGGPATAAKFRNIANVTEDTAGNLFIADDFANVIRKVDVTTGIITTAVGTGTMGYSGDGGYATAATLNSPISMFFDDSDNLIFSDELNNVVRKVSATGIITTIYGNGIAGYSADGTAADTASLDNIASIVPDDSGNLFLLDVEHNVVLKIDRSGILSTYAGIAGVTTYSGDGGMAIHAGLNTPWGISSSGNNIYISDYIDGIVRKVDSNGIIGSLGSYREYSGLGGQATDALFCNPTDVAIDDSGNIFIAAPTNNMVFKIDPTGTISNYAELNSPTYLAVDHLGNLFVSEPSSGVILRIDAATRTITNFAGIGSFGYSGDGGPAINAMLNYPHGIAVDTIGNLYIADASNYAIRKVDAFSGIITTLVTGTYLFRCNFIKVDNYANIYVSDYGGNLLEINQSTLSVNVLAGDTTGCISENPSGFGGPADSAEICAINGIAFFDTNHIFITVENNLLMVDRTTGILTATNPSVSPGKSGDGSSVDAGYFYNPGGMAFDRNGDLYIADTWNNVVQKVNYNFYTGIPIVGKPAVQIKVAPNPNHGVFEVEGIFNNINNGSIVNIHMANIYGQTIYNTTTTVFNNCMKVKIDPVFDLTSGMYYLTVSGEAGSCSISVSIEK